MITLVSSQKWLPPNISAPSVVHRIISFEFGGDEKDEFIFQFSLSEILDWVGIHHNFYVDVQATKVPAQYI